MCSHELRKLNTETTKSVRPLPVRCESCLKTRSFIFAALHTNRQEAFCHLIFQGKARFPKEKVWMCTMLMYLCPGAVYRAECVLCLACISAARPKHLQIIIQRPTNRLLTLM